MGAFDLKGGIFYSIAKNPHYAYRELVYKEVIQGRTDPGMLVSGEEFLFILSRVLSLVEDIEGEARRRAAHEALAAEISKQLAGITDISVEVIAEGVTIRFYDIQFNADSSVLAEPGKAKLREVTEALKTRYIRGKRILVSGHTALAGVETERQRISLERAQAAASYLVELGFRRENQITVRGFGADRPLADNNTPEGMARNRRVEITILDD
jgi:outer membrane protein OmpA-like peptidoglycan-associated protein